MKPGDVIIGRTRDYSHGFIDYVSEGFSPLVSIRALVASYTLTLKQIG